MLIYPCRCSNLVKFKKPTVASTYKTKYFKHESRNYAIQHPFLRLDESIVKPVLVTITIKQ